MLQHGGTSALLSLEVSGIIQLVNRELTKAGRDGPPESEDCLFLNVYTPAGAGCQSSGRPVLVWIHGGWLREGTASQPMFDGSRFAAEQGIVVVTFNYRLNGVLGDSVLEVAC